MHILRFINRAALIATAAMVLVPAASAEWTQWNGVNRDGRASAFNLPADWPTSLTEQWTVALGNSDATPIVKGNRVYLHSRFYEEERELITCLNAADGSQIWQQSSPSALVDDAARAHAGPRSTPVLAGGRLFTLGLRGLVSCFNAEIGELLWTNHEYKKMPRFYTSSAPVVVGDRAIYQVGGADTMENDDDPSGEDVSAIVAFNVESGEIIWRIEGKQTWYASPALLTLDGETQVVAEYKGGLLGIDPARGTVLWEVLLEGEGRRPRFGASPVVDGNRVHVTGFGQGSFAYDIERNGESYTATLAWHNEQIEPEWATPVLADGLLFGLSDRSLIYCLDAATGETLWVDETNRNDKYGWFVNLGGAIAALPNRHDLIIFEPSREGFSPIMEYTVADRDVFSFPVFSGNSLYVQDMDSITKFSF